MILSSRSVNISTRYVPLADVEVSDAHEGKPAFRGELSIYSRFMLLKQEELLMDCFEKFGGPAATLCKL